MCLRRDVFHASEATMKRGQKLTLIKSWKTSRRVWGVVKGSVTSFHVCQVDTTGEYHCSCQGFKPGRLCSHLVRLVIEHFGKNAIEVIE